MDMNSQLVQLTMAGYITEERLADAHDRHLAAEARTHEERRSRQRWLRLTRPPTIRRRVA